MTLAARKVRRTKQLQLVVIDTERRVACEIDALDVSMQREVVQRTAEAEPPVFRSEREEMTFERRPVGAGELSDDEAYRALGGGGRIEEAGGATGFFGCFGFFTSRLLLC